MFYQKNPQTLLGSFLVRKKRNPTNPPPPKPYKKTPHFFYQKNPIFFAKKNPNLTQNPPNLTNPPPQFFTKKNPKPHQKTPCSSPKNPPQTSSKNPCFTKKPPNLTGEFSGEKKKVQVGFLMKNWYRLGFFLVQKRVFFCTHHACDKCRWGSDSGKGMGHRLCSRGRAGYPPPPPPSNAYCTVLPCG